MYKPNPEKAENKVNNTWHFLSLKEKYKYTYSNTSGVHNVVPNSSAVFRSISPTQYLYNPSFMFMHVEI